MWIATSTVHTTEIATLQEQKYYKVSEKEKEITWHDIEQTTLDNKFVYYSD